MFDHTHYVPVLRWRMAEWCALRELEEAIKRRMTPLIELLPKDFVVNVNSRKKKSISEIVDNKVCEIEENWGRSPFFIDFRHLNSCLRKETISIHELFARKLKSKGLNPIPVIGFGSGKDIGQTVSTISGLLKSGVCIRIHPHDIHDEAFQKRLTDETSFLKHSPNEVDILFDNQIHGSDSIDIKDITAQLPDLLSWRSLTLIGGSFPTDLTGFSVGEHELQRDDYLYWLEQVRRKGFRRLPAFGDYTVQHPFIKELPSFPNLSASIRYTSENYWVIMRGQGVRNESGSGYAQWPANAAMLCARNEFSGRDFCRGDEYIYNMSEQTEKTGNAKTWIQASINHHLTFVVRQLASLFGS